jgi:hypothetical protein
MKLRIAMIAAFAAASLAGPVLAAGPKANVVERDSRGHPTKVEIEGQVYAVCQGDQSDGCINPREAGLKFGNNPINYWPGKPASEK